MKPYFSYIMKPWFVLGMAALAITLTFQNCGQPRYDMKDTLTNLTASQSTPAPTNPGGTVCDPGAGTTTLTGGLVAELYYMDPKNSGNASTVLNFFDPNMAIKSPHQIFFSQINTPPQLFDKGYVTQTGDTVKDNSGNPLLEWFALKYFSELRVTRGADEGEYEFASLSDDGHIFEAYIDGKWQGIITDDGLHSPKWGCSIRTINLKKDQPVPIRVYYYQGPAQHISNMLHWRKVTRVALGEKECGFSSTNYFYDPATSTPLSPYQDLLARGWTVVPPSVYFLPSTVVNPCINK